MNKTFKAFSPLVKKALLSGRLFKPKADLVHAIEDIQPEYDVSIPVSDGSKILVNVF